MLSGNVCANERLDTLRLYSIRFPVLMMTSTTLSPTYDLFVEVNLYEVRTLQYVLRDIDVGCPGSASLP